MKTNNKTGQSVKFLDRARALIFIDNNQQLYNAIKKDERLNMKRRPSEIEDNDPDKVTYLHNPLPVPKKKAHKKLDYDYGKSEGADDWDIDIKDSNLFDYDV